MKLVVLGIVLILIKTEAEDEKCGNWKSFKDEKCIKIFDQAGLKNFDDAIKTCRSNESILLTIHFQEEQNFIESYLKESKIADNLWIGIKYVKKTYKWADNSSVEYKNWAEGNPKNKSDHCTQIESDENYFGKWSDVLCTKKNLVVCQKSQTWSLSHLQSILLDTIKNPVPIGFIYVQLAREKSPSDIWPWMIWKDISADYAGLFFRVSGAQASEFGKVQEENIPRLTEVDNVSTNEVAWAEVQKHRSPGDRNTSLPIGGRSLWINTGDKSGTAIFASFVTSGGEVRPKNMAIKVWRRMS